MTSESQPLSALQLIDDLDKRVITSCTHVKTAAKKYPLEKRRTIVQHIKECMSEAKVHNDIPEFAHELRNYLVHDFWDDLKTVSAQTEFSKKNLEDFAVVATTDAPAHHQEIQEAIYGIVPEDIPEVQKQPNETNKDYTQRLLQCRVTFGYGVRPEDVDPNARLTNEEFAQRLLSLRLTHGY